MPGPKDATLAPKDRYLTFHHMALEVRSVDDLFKAREFLAQHGIKFVFEGRRGAGCNVSLEFLDPDGYTIELTCEMEQIGWNQSARPHNMHRPAKSLLVRTACTGQPRASKRRSAILSNSLLALQLGMQAVTVISISSSGAFSEATVTVVRAGLLVGKYLPYSSL